MIASTAMAAILGFSAMTVGGFSTAPTAQAETALSQFKASKGGTPADIGIANDDRLVEMLKKEGIISQKATPAQIEKALDKYKEAKEASITSSDKGNSVFSKKNDQHLKEKAKNKKFKNGKASKAKKTKLDSIDEEYYEGAVREDKVLVLAIDFPDYAKSSITQEETDMFYEDYTHEHFQNMIFGEKGYKGPKGQKFVSMKQFYEEQSGGSYTMDGTVAGWYTADHPAAYYGGNVPAPDGSDARARELVFEALKKAGQDPEVDLSEYDAWDRDDYDGDGTYNEPDGIIDHLMVIHAGVGEEAGGGKLAGDAIWSHRWNLGSLVGVPGGTSNSDRFGGKLGAYDYTIEPEDGAAGVFAHEFGHDLGLPDEYDTQYSGTGEAVAYWSIMASGSWSGDVPGTEPTGFSPYAKEFLQAAHGGNWLSGTSVDAKYVTKTGTSVLLDEAATKGTNNDAVRVNLPNKITKVNTPASGSKEYFSGKGNNLNNSLSVKVDLTKSKTAALKFKAWYDIEKDWDYASVKVNGKTIKGNITTTENPNAQNPGDGITGTSNGWVDASFDLSQYAGQSVTVELNYWTDPYTAQAGFYADDLVITADGKTIVSDNAEKTPVFTLAGFTQDNGTVATEHYYLLEWRSHNGVDEGLANIRRGASLMTYDKGLVVWYVDPSYDDNWTGLHPGEGFLGVVDADQHTNYWSDGSPGATRYQLNDAAFSLKKTSKMFLDYRDLLGLTLKDTHTKNTPLFDDRVNYSNPGMVDAGRNVPTYGLKFKVTGESKDGTVSEVLIYK
ncbi:immune inhibitor A domain-containing protein [Planococcus sp. YIM B11945]|uniref:immune inhibitor A domain-containing protein n=1 Tax=Planococcus sp. YIM B11945 TaxID=3435410 RepID=UPI003D7DF53F